MFGVSAGRVRSVRAAASGGGKGGIQEGHRIAARAQHRGGRPTNILEA